jgi:hypothetical protein
MTPDSHNAIVDRLTDCLNSHPLWKLEGMNRLSEEQPSWADPVLDRVAAVIADVDDIEYSAGYVTIDADHTVAAGAIVAVTSTIVVASSFTAPARTLRPEGDVKVWTRAAVRRVNVDEVHAPDSKSRDKLQQAGMARVTLVVEGGEELQLPPRLEVAPLWDSALLAYLPKLLSP